MDAVEMKKIPDYIGRYLGDVLAENIDNGIIFKIGSDEGNGFIYAAPVTNRTKDWFESWTIRRLQSLKHSIATLKSKEGSKAQYAEYIGYAKKPKSFTKWTAENKVNRKKAEQNYNWLINNNILDAIITNANWSSAYPNTIILAYKGRDNGEFWLDSEFCKRFPEFKKED